MEMQRISSHAVETRSCDIIKSKVNASFENGDLLYREITGRDYGIDGIIELFDDGNITGKFALAQVKGTSEKIVPLKKTPNYVSCNISASNARYAFQNRMPVILFYVSIKAPDCIYFMDIRQAISDEQREKINNGQKNITIRIPAENVEIGTMNEVYEIICNGNN